MAWSGGTFLASQIWLCNDPSSRIFFAFQSRGPFVALSGLRFLLHFKFIPGTSAIKVRPFIPVAMDGFDIFLAWVGQIRPFHISCGDVAISHIV